MFYSHHLLLSADSDVKYKLLYISVLQKLRAAKGEHAVFVMCWEPGGCVLRYLAMMVEELQSQFVDDAGHAGVAVQSPEDEADVYADAFVVARGE